jgi:hypothetical protein
MSGKRDDGDGDGGRRPRPTKKYGVSPDSQPVRTQSAELGKAPPTARTEPEMPMPPEVAAIVHEASASANRLLVAGPPPPQRRGGGALRPDGIEVDLIHEQDAPEAGRWRACEVWTQKSIYAIDAALRCIAVLDRQSGKADARHRFVGARLMGGEQKEGGRRTFSYPFPVPGGDAVFQLATTQAGVFGHTSPVERVLMRVRITHADIPDSDTLWADLGRTLDQG